MVTEDPPVRRKDKEIQDPGLIDRIMAEAQVCRLGLSRDNVPYIVPVAFGYDGRTLYFHTAREGTKLDFIASNPRVCFEVEHDVKVVPNDSAACSWSFSFYSVIGFGTVEELTEPAAKVSALNQVMRHYSHRDWDLNDEAMTKTRLWRIAIERITGKQSKDKIVT